MDVLPLLLLLCAGGWWLPHFNAFRPRNLAAVTESEQVKFCNWAGGISDRDVLHRFISEFNSEQHTLGHVGCPACEGNRKAAMASSALVGMSFPAAAASWLENRKLIIAPRTVFDYQQYFKSLGAFLGEIELRQINIGHVRSYQQHRLSGGVGAPRINVEVGTLRQLLKEARLWHKIQPYYKRLREVGKGPGRAMTREEWDHILKIGNSRGKWFVALNASMLSVHTGAGPGEIRHLRLKDIDLPHSEFTIRRGVKNGWRVRTMPLSPPAFLAMKKLHDRCLEKGGGNPEDHLLPHRADKGGKTWDFSRPQGGWYKAWRNIIAKASEEYPHLAGLRPYDCRHTFGTWLFGSPVVSERTAVELMGWADARMADRYTHLKMKAKREAINAISESQSPRQRIGPQNSSWTGGFVVWKNKQNNT